jgi:hypothetical protein
VNEVRRRNRQFESQDPPPTADSIGWLGWLAAFGVFVVVVVLLSYS